MIEENLGIIEVFWIKIDRIFFELNRLVTARKYKPNTKHNCLVLAIFISGCRSVCNQREKIFAPRRNGGHMVN